MEVSLKSVKNNFAQYIVIFLLFGGGWYYLDQQRVSVMNAKIEAIKMEAKAQVLVEEVEKDKLENEKKERELDKKMKANDAEAELSKLALKFIEESAGINFLTQCGDDPEHNKLAKRALALLDLIEAKANALNQKEMINFVKKQRFGIGGWTSNCKP